MRIKKQIKTLKILLIVHAYMPHTHVHVHTTNELKIKTAAGCTDATTVILLSPIIISKFGV